jgi:hypothetical protein
MTATPDRHDGESIRVSHYGFHVGYVLDDSGPGEPGALPIHAPGIPQRQDAEDDSEQCAQAPDPAQAQDQGRDGTVVHGRLPHRRLRVGADWGSVNVSGHSF